MVGLDFVDQIVVKLFRFAFQNTWRLDCLETGYFGVDRAVALVLTFSGLVAGRYKDVLDRHDVFQRRLVPARQARLT